MFSLHASGKFHHVSQISKNYALHGKRHSKTDTLGNMLRGDKVLGVPHEARVRDD